MRITEGDAGSRTGKTMRTTQTWNDCEHLILRWTQRYRMCCTNWDVRDQRELKTWTDDSQSRTDETSLTRCVCCDTDSCTGERGAAFTPTVYISRHTRAAGALIHLPLFIGAIHHPLVQTRLPRVCNTKILTCQTFRVQHSWGNSIHVLRPVPRHA